VKRCVKRFVAVPLERVHPSLACLAVDLAQLSGEAPVKGWVNPSFDASLSISRIGSSADETRLICQSQPSGCE
jgi:hypothetical protein